MSSAFAVRQRKSTGQDAILDRILAGAAILVAAVLVLYLLSRFILAPLTAIRHVVVESGLTMSEEQILALAGLQGQESYYSIQTSMIQKRLEADPLVRAARVVKVFPDTLRISLYAREPVALVLARAGGRTLPVLVDKDGIVFKIGISRAEVDLPVLSGLDLGEQGLGSRVPQSYRSVIADLLALKAKSPSLLRVISEVRVAPLGRGGTVARPRDATPPPTAAAEPYELLLYFTTSPVRVRALGPVDDVLVKYSLMVIDLLSNRGILSDIEELDFRSGDVVYGKKGG
jgi:cell division protein FtsQ